MKRVRFGPKLINLSSCMLIYHHEDTREEDMLDDPLYDHRREHFSFYTSTQEGVYPEVAYVEEPGFDEFKSWFFHYHKVDGVVHDDVDEVFNWRDAEERMLSE